MMTLFVMME